MVSTPPPPAANSHAESDAFHALSALLHTRYSCRAFVPDALPRAAIEQILATAQRTASWCNAQPWQLTIASGATLSRLRDALQTHLAAASSPNPDLPWPREYRGVYQERRRACGWGLYDALGIAKSDREASARQAAQNFTMFGAPHVAIVTSDEALGVYGAVDCGAYVSNFMLAAHSLGVGSIAQAALASYPGVLREVLGIGADRTIVCGISFGHADLQHPANQFRTTRAHPGDSVIWRD
ncbi:nitroreductase [Acidovorax radicis]|jgi:nitroreductase|uniref:nitroreductase n=1 Tax=Acidovorax radicis TaxID=758826 RepID=UPI001CFC3EAA|nr:nitroreductase [Acidovorax radicis]UCU99693.1 nitroreductase [Acidovorax radicis]